MEVVVRREIPDVAFSFLRLKHSEKDIDGHLLVGIC